MEKADSASCKRLCVAVLKILARQNARTQCTHDKCKIFTDGKAALLCPRGVVDLLLNEGLILHHDNELEITPEGRLHVARALAGNAAMTAQHRDMETRQLRDPAGDLHRRLD